MGPLRSLYEQEGDLERALVQQTPMVLRPVQISDCGKRCTNFGRSKACMYAAKWLAQEGGLGLLGEYRITKTLDRVCFHPTDTAYSALMGSSAMESTGQDVSAAEELVADQLVGDLEGQTRDIGGEGQASAETGLQHDFVGELQR